MTKNIRSVLFYFFTLIFITITPLLILHSAGYRYDFDSKKITKTGGFYFKILPSSAQIYINDKLVKKTNVLFNSVLAQNFLPKKYKISIRKEGYQPWEKTMEIKENEATKATNVILIPAETKFLFLNQKVKNLFISPDGKSAILIKKYKITNDNLAAESKEENEKRFYLTFFNLEKQTEEILIKDDFFVPDLEFLDLQWSSDSKKNFIKTKIKEKEQYYVLELSNTFPLSPIPVDLLKKSQEIYFNPEDNRKIFFLNGNAVSEIDYFSKNIRQIAENVLAYAISEENMIYISNSGEIFKINLLNLNREKISSFPLEKNSNYELSVSPYDIFLKKDAELYRFDDKSADFKKIYGPVTDIKISSDFKKAVYSNNREVFVMFLKDIIDQPERKNGETEVLARFSETISNVFWYNSEYILFAAGEKIKIAELDNRDKIQIWDLKEIENKKMFFNQKDKKLYILSNNENLFISDKLLP